MKSEIASLSKFIDRLQGSGRYFFSRRDVRQALSYKSQPAFDSAFYRLLKSRRIACVRGDFFIITPLEYQAIGCLPASWFIDPFMKSIGVDYYVALLSAAAMQGASHQQVMVFQVIAEKMMRPIQIGQVHIEFHYQKHIPKDFLHAVQTETGTMQVANPEVIVCDLLKYPNASGQIHNIATVFCELIEQVSAERLLAYIEAYPIGVVIIQRLGYLLEYLELGFDTDKLLSWLSQKKVEYRPLVMGSTTPVLEKNKRWHILVNEKVETDL